MSFASFAILTPFLSFLAIFEEFGEFFKARRVVKTVVLQKQNFESMQLKSILQKLVAIK